jgi:hypothetical protein
MKKKEKKAIKINKLIKSENKTTLVMTAIHTQQLYKQIKQLIIHYKYIIKIKVSKLKIQIKRKIYPKIYIKP